MSEMDAGHLVKIGDLGRQCGVSDQTIRFYEKKGLIKSLRNTPGGRRLFYVSSIDDIRFIKQAQACGFTLKEIRDLLQAKDRELVSGQTLVELLSQKSKKIHELVQNFEQLRAMVLALRPECEALGTLLVSNGKAGYGS